MKLAAWLMILLLPVVGWAQSSGNGVPAATVKPVEPSKAVRSVNPPAIREVNLSQVSDRLGLSPAQQGLWDSFKDRVDAYTSAYYRQKPVVPSPEDAATHQIGRMVDNLQNRLAALEDVETAAKSLYASLTPLQQKTANEMLILAIPSFTPSSDESSRPSPDARSKDKKPDAGKRSRRGGGMGGAMSGTTIEN